MTDHSLPKVTHRNYYEPHIQMAYMGASQFKAFRKCEAAALASLRGEWTEPKTPALLAGGYVDAYFSGELVQYKEANPELFSSRYPYGLKAEFRIVEKVIERMEGDRLYMLLMSGRKQVIRTGSIAGVPFKIKIDCLLDGDVCKKIAQLYPEAAPALGMCDGAIVDQKLMENFKGVWSPEDHARLPFIEYWGYDIQGAIYAEIEGNMLPFVIAAGTKENEPDLGAFYVSDQDLAAKLAEVEDEAPRYQAIKEGRIVPRRCENCAYCRRTKRLHGIYDYKDVMVE